MAKDRERQPEMDYYELRRRREQVLNERARKRPEWDVPEKRPARPRPARKAESAPTGPVKTAATGTEVFPPKRPQPETRQTPLVRSPIQVPRPAEEPKVATAQPVETPVAASPEEREWPVRPEEAPASVVPAQAAVEEPMVDIPVQAADVEPMVDVPAQPVDAEPAVDAPEQPVDVQPEAPEAIDAPFEDEESAFDDSDEAYSDVTDEDVMDENIGNHPFKPFFELAGNVASKVSGMRQKRAEKAQAENGEEAPKKRGLKGLFGRKKAPEADWEDMQTDGDWSTGMPEEAVDDLPETPTEPFDDAAQQNIPVEQPFDDTAPQDIPMEQPFDDTAPQDIPVEQPFDDAAPQDIPAEDAFDLPVNGTVGVVGDDAFDDDSQAEVFGEHHFDDAPAEKAEPKKKFSLKGLFGRKKPKSDDDLLAELDDFDDEELEDFGDDEPAEEFEAEGAAEQPDDFDAINAEENAPEEQTADVPEDTAPTAEPFFDEPIGMEQPADIDVQSSDGNEEPIELMQAADSSATDGFEVPAHGAETVEQEPESFDEWDEEDDFEEESPKKPARGGFFARFRRGGRKKHSDEDLLALLDDDDDGEEADWDELDDPDGVDEPVGSALPKDAPYSPEPDESLFFDEEDSDIERRDDMNEKDLVASQMAEGIGERTLSRKERRELAERLAAEKAAQTTAAAEPEEAKIAPEMDDEVDEPTRAFKPVRAVREAPVEPVAEPEADDYDLFEEEQEEAEQASRKAAPARKAAPKKEKKPKKLDDDDFDLFDDEDDEDDYDDDDDEPVRRRGHKKDAHKSNRYDDYDDDDDDYDDDDYDDDEEEGGGFLWGFFKAILAIVVILAAAIIVLNVLSARNIAPASKAVDAIAGVLPAGISEKLFPGANTADDALTVVPTEEPVVAEEPVATEIPAPTEIPVSNSDNTPEFDPAAQEAEPVTQEADPAAEGNP